MDIEEHIQKLREHVPDNKTDDEIRAVIEETNGDEEAIQARIAAWWEEAANEDEEEAAPPPPPPAQESSPPPPAPENPPKRSARSSTKKGGGSGGSDKEMMDFRHLMVKGLELKKSKAGGSEKCVIYMDVTCRTFFCAKQKNAPSAKAFRVEEIAEASASSDNEKIISIMHKEGSLDLEVSSPKVRDYLVRMLNKLFTLEKAKAAEGGGAAAEPDSGGGGAREKKAKKSSREGKSSKSSKSSSREEERRAHPGVASEVAGGALLLAE